MSELGRLVIDAPEALMETRRKVYEMSKSFGLENIYAIRFSTILTELLRLGSSSSTSIRISAGQYGREGEHGFQITIVFSSDIILPAVVNHFFHSIKLDKADNGFTQFSGFKQFPDPSFYPDSYLIEKARQILAQTSKEELFRQLVQKNEALERSAKEVQTAKELTDDATEKLKERVSELARARRAMLNIMDDLDDAYKLVSSSIAYASNIQRSILPEDKQLENGFADFFIIWEPRDKVGGDIYYYKPWGEGHIFALGDCTGHGVPGAFMTLIVNGALEGALREVTPGDTGMLMQCTHQKIQSTLRQQKEEGASDDGVEMGICYLPPDSEQMVFSGARFSLFAAKDGTVSEIKGDKKGMGYRGIPYDARYTNHDIKPVNGRRFYMTSDGLIDQIGGSKRRGFGKKRFRRLLESVHPVPLKDQKPQIIKTFEEYQGKEKRRDDLAIAGFSF